MQLPLYVFIMFIRSFLPPNISTFGFAWLVVLLFHSKPIVKQTKAQFNFHYRYKVFKKLANSERNIFGAHKISVNFCVDRLLRLHRSRICPFFARGRAGISTHRVRERKSEKQAHSFIHSLIIIIISFRIHIFAIITDGIRFRRLAKRHHMAHISRHTHSLVYCYVVGMPRRWTTRLTRERLSPDISINTHRRTSAFFCFCFNFYFYFFLRIFFFACLLCTRKATQMPVNSRHCVRRHTLPLPPPPPPPSPLKHCSCTARSAKCLMTSTL